MTFVDHLKGAKAEELYLEVAFGLHVIAGDLTKSIVTGSSPTHVIKLQQMLGDAFGRGWKGPKGVWMRGLNIDSTKYKFYPGIASPGNADATQGIDSVFTDDTPHSNCAWIRVECPPGVPAFGTKNDPPTGLTGVYECQLGDIYDADGDIVATDVLIDNPADVLIFGCLVIRKFDPSRIDFASLATLRTASNVTETPDYTTLPQGVGLTGKYYEGTSFSTFKSQRVDPVVQYDASTGAPALDLTPTSFSVRFEGKIRPKYTETYTFYLTHNDSGKLWVQNLSTAIIDEASSGTHSATKSLHEDSFYDIKMDWTNASGNSEFKLEWESASQPRQVVPQDRLYPKAEAVPRFRTNIAFKAPTDFDTFLRAVLFTCNGGYQDVNGKLTFFCLEDQTPSFALDETNLKKDTLKFYPRYSQEDLKRLPNRFIAEGRDLDSRYLEPFDPPLVYDIPELQELAGRPIEETVNVGNCTRWQGLKNMAFYAKLKTAPEYTESQGMPSTLKLLPGDVLTVSHSTPDWEDKQMLAVETTDNSIDSAADERIFKLLEWN